jgi:predicted ATPase
MRIEHIKIQGYRSLYDVGFAPRPLTVFVGPNNAGKSNLVDAIDFLSQVHRTGLTNAVIAKGGFEAIAHRRQRRVQRISIELTASFSYAELLAVLPLPSSVDTTLKQPELLVHMDHRFSIAPASTRIMTEFQLTSERLSVDVTRDGVRSALFCFDTEEELAWANRDFIATLEVDVRRTLIGPIMESSDLGEILRSVGGRNQLVGNALAMGSMVIAYFGLRLGNLCIYQLSPIAGRLPGAPMPSADMDRYGKNLPSIVSHMQTNFPEQWAHVLEKMDSIAPTVEDIQVRLHDRTSVLQFSEPSGRRSRPVDEMSDGTIQSLALLTALYDPRKPLIVVEEPENSVHPWGVRTFVDAFREVTAPSRGKQVIVTTHAPVLIEYLVPDDIYLVWREDGRTSVRPLTELDPDVARAWADGTTDLFSFLDSGLLREAVPGGVG